MEDKIIRKITIYENNEGGRKFVTYLDERMSGESKSVEFSSQKFDDVESALIDAAFAATEWDEDREFKWPEDDVE